MEKLEKLLYRKKSAENLMNIWAKGIQTYSDYIKSCEKEIEKDIAELYKHNLRVEIMKTEIPLRHFITSFRLTKREVENYIIPEIEKLTKDKKGIEFDDYNKKMKELADNTLFSDYEPMPANIEQPKVIEDIKKNIELIHNINRAIENKLKNEEDEYIKAVQEKELFENNLKLTTLLKRLREREDYYNNQFLPKFKKDMKECNKYLDKYLERARELIKLGIDIKMTFLLEEYEKNKKDKEKVWLFYTALKTRVNRVMKEMNRNSGKFKGKMHLAKNIV